MNDLLNMCTGLYVYNELKGDGVLLFAIGNAVIGCYCGLIDEIVSKR